MKVVARACRHGSLGLAIMGASVISAAACRDASSGTPAAAASDTQRPPAPERLGATRADELARGPGCIRGGSTREEVRAIMGEPDSVSFGAWLYGRSSVSFGYGVVVDLSNEGGNLVLC